MALFFILFWFDHNLVYLFVFCFLKIGRWWLLGNCGDKGRQRWGLSSCRWFNRSITRYNYIGEPIEIFDEIENNYLLVKSPSTLCILVSEIKHDEVALLLKLNVPAADLVCFLPRNPSQYIKISFNVDYILLYVMLHSFWYILWFLDNFLFQVAAINSHVKLAVIFFKLM